MLFATHMVIFSAPCIELISTFQSERSCGYGHVLTIRNHQLHQLRLLALQIEITKRRVIATDSF